MTNTQYYLSYVNEFCTIEGFASFYGMDIEKAKIIIEKGKIDLNQKKRIKYECCCCDISQNKWDELMNNTKSFDGNLLLEMIIEYCPELDKDLQFDFYNPYMDQCLKSDTHFIYIHSAIEYFFKII